MLDSNPKLNGILYESHSSVWTFPYFNEKHNKEVVNMFFTQT